MVYVYILRLQSHKYYVGKTQNPMFRLTDHFSQDGSEWTKIFKPLSVERVISDCDDFDEDKYTIIYMSKYGMENVRGGSFCSRTLDSATKKVLKKMIKTSDNKCYTCNKPGHFSRDCPQKNIDLTVRCEICGVDSCDKVCIYIETSKTDMFLCTDCEEVFRVKQFCVRCGRQGHYLENCYARRNIFGKPC